MKKCTVQMVADVVNRLAPRRLAEEWDNPGLLIGEPSAEVKEFSSASTYSTKISRGQSNSTRN